MDRQSMKYDYIILGGGASGLSLAYRMAKHSFFNDKQIAIVEKVDKNQNDRTWSFWESGAGPFEHIVKKKWSNLEFYSSDLEKRLDIAPYQYKMIAGIDFYNYVIPQIEEAENIHFIKGEVLSVLEEKDQVRIQVDDIELIADTVFKSFPSVGPETYKKDIYVDQHFKGYFIETPTDTFEEDTATFMDFRIPQEGDARFLYVLPTSKRKALVEVAIFSNSLLEQQQYDDILTNYIADYLKISDYKIEEEEFGIIPMTTYPFFNHNTERLFHIGTGGGVVKSSSGFAFKRIQEHSEDIVECIVNGKPISNSYKKLKGRFLLYDKTMLHAMLHNGVPGEQIFTDLFRKKKAKHILKFLDQKTSLLEEVNIFTAPPWYPFTKSFFHVM